MVLSTDIPALSLLRPPVASAAFWSYNTAVITTFAALQLMNPVAGNLGTRVLSFSPGVSS